MTAKQEGGTEEVDSRPVRPCPALGSIRMNLAPPCGAPDDLRLKIPMKLLLDSLADVFNSILASSVSYLRKSFHPAVIVWEPAEITLGVGSAILHPACASSSPP